MVGSGCHGKRFNGLRAVFFAYMDVGTPREQDAEAGFFQAGTAKNLHPIERRAQTPREQDAEAGFFQAGTA